MANRPDRRERRKLRGYDFNRHLADIREHVTTANNALIEIVQAKQDACLTAPMLSMLLVQAATAIGAIWTPLREIESIADRSIDQIQEMQDTIGRLERAVAELERQLSNR